MIDSGQRKTALVTGASAGIGQAFARLLAQEGYDLVLTARREDRLRALAGDLSGRFNIDARIVVADLADPGAPARIYEQSTSGGRRVDLLVNNAGYGLGGGLLDVPWEEHARFIQVMVTAVVDLTYRCLPAMIERRYGWVINVASVAGLAPGTAGHTLYGAAKAFVVRFSESIALEVRKHNVNVTALCPGFTYTEFHDVSGTRERVNRLPRWMWMQAAPVVRAGLEAVMRGDIVSVPGRTNRLLVMLARMMPQRVVFAAMKRYSVSFRKFD